MCTQPAVIPTQHIFVSICNILSLFVPLLLYNFTCFLPNFTVPSNNAAPTPTDLWKLGEHGIVIFITGVLLAKALSVMHGTYKNEFVLFDNGHSVNRLEGKDFAAQTNNFSITQKWKREERKEHQHPGHTNYHISSAILTDSINSYDFSASYYFLKHKSEKDYLIKRTET